ncbi:hypothetical protein GGR55DRAFT_591363 [Xylaria sp. FL0064]|nr:hypothetical protein GGR55DRAFT_591363 [Xylaria sp. FL0064]
MYNKRQSPPSPFCLVSSCSYNLFFLSFFLSILVLLPYKKQNKIPQVFKHRNYHQRSPRQLKPRHIFSKWVLVIAPLAVVVIVPAAPAATTKRETSKNYSIRNGG